MLKKHQHPPSEVIFPKQVVVAVNIALAPTIKEAPQFPQDTSKMLKEQASVNAN